MPGRAILTAEEMRDAEQATIDSGTPVGELMERAGRAVADIAWRIAGRSETLILCGPGNNGGDGYVVARLLAERGCDVRIAALADPASDAAAEARRKWNGEVVTIDEAKSAPLVIDALFGTGLKRPLDRALARQLGNLVARARHGIAVDLPSGIETDGGTILSPVPDFDVTVALGALKPAHLLQPARRHMGHVLLGEIGIAAESDLTEIARPSIAAPGPDDHKYIRGYVFVAKGPMAGAASLTAQAAMRGGAGYVVMAGPERGDGPQALVMKQATDPKTLGKLLEDERIDCAVIGPGLGRDKKARQRLDAVLASGRRLVLDADALVLLGEKDGPQKLASFAQIPVLTPHAGEFDRMFGAGDESKIVRARQASKTARSVVVFKGADTVVAAPDGRAGILADAPGSLATAGTGDVLSGLVAARYAATGDPFAAACQAVWLHAEAAQFAGPAMIADDVVAAIPRAIAGCLAA